MPNLILLAVVLLLISACGGGGGGGSSSGSMPPVVQVPTPSSKETFENTRAIDPLPSFKAVQLPAFNYFDYRKEVDDSPIPDFVWYNAPDVELQDDYVPMTHRAFKLWSRRIDQVIYNSNHPTGHLEPGENGVARVHILSGYDQPHCGGGQGWACGSHYGTDLSNPVDRPGASNTPATIYAPIFFERTTTNDGQLTADGFRIIVHEFGHMFDHQGIGVAEGETHTDCSSTGMVGVMCHEYDGAPITVTEQDFDGITHHYSLKEPSDHEVFGIWASVRNQNSNLNEFGVRVTRTLSVNNVLAPNRNQPMSSLIEDRIRIETMIDGTASTDITYPVNTGTASWNGDLIAVDTQRFEPVLGDATLTMDLSNTDLLQARFTLDSTRYHNDGSISVTDSLPFGYTLMRSGDTWLDEQGRVDASFYAIGNDDTAAVAGRLDDESINLIGAFGGIRNDVLVPGPIPMPPVGPEG